LFDGGDDQTGRHHGFFVVVVGLLWANHSYVECYAPDVPGARTSETKKTAHDDGGSRSRFKTTTEDVPLPSWPGRLLVGTSMMMLLVDLAKPVGCRCRCTIVMVGVDHSFSEPGQTLPQ